MHDTHTSLFANEYARQHKLSGEANYMIMLKANP
jgi:hypothetical protein